MTACVHPEDYLPTALRVARESLDSVADARRDPHVVESVALDALMDAILACKPGDNLGGLVTTITRRHAADWRVHRLARCRDARRTGPLGGLEVLATGPCTLSTDDRAAIWAAVDALPWVQSRVIRSRYESGGSLKDVARRLEITHAAAHRAARLALGSLRKRLAPLFVDK